MKNLYIELLEVLFKEKSYLSLNEINKKLTKEISSRTLNRALNELIKFNRVIKEGTTNSVKYAIDDILRYYKRYEFLYVHKDDQIAGYLFKLKDVYRFYYTNDFIINFSPEISTIKLDITYYDYKELPPVFEENIPEGINREILETSSKQSDEFELLQKLDDNIGDLYFSKSPESISSKLAHGESYLSLLPDILGENTFPQVLEDFNLNLDEIQLFPENYDLTKLEIKKSDGISGFQYKKLVNIDFKTRNIVTRENESKEYILKPYSKLKADPNNAHYFPHVSLNEHLFMTFAKNELGFRVPYNAIVKRESDEEYHYIVKRFDRYKMHRFSKNTFAPFLGLVSSTKYDTSSEKMFKRIALELINPKEKMELLKHYAYSVIIMHEDMHTKNLSLIFEKEKVLFSPLYDIACTGIYDTSKGYESHITINGKQMNIRPNDFKKLCEILKVDFKEFKKEALQIAQIYEKRLPLYITALKELGDIPFYNAKIKKKVGENADWVREKEAIDLKDVLFRFHSKRVKKLRTLGWLNN